MENREILIANTKTQKRSKLTTDATTLGELKAAMTAAGIDYEGLTFTEGITKTQLLEDDTQLPQNVMYKGQSTNNLVILLTNTKKNIASGSISRKEAYELIKANNLQDRIKALYGRNFTMVSTADLMNVINEATLDEVTSDAAASAEETPAEKPSVASLDDEYEDDNYNDDGEDDEEDNKEEASVNFSTSEVITSMIHSDILQLYINNIIEYADLCDLVTALSNFVAANRPVKPAEPSEPVSTSDGVITDDDIDDMLDALNM